MSIGTEKLLFSDSLKDCSNSLPIDEAIKAVQAVKDEKQSRKRPHDATLHTFLGLAPVLQSTPKERVTVASSSGWSLFRKTSRPTPAYLRVPEINGVVDAFRFAPETQAMYFLSHYHCDHYGGLSSSFSSGIIYGSDITLSLVQDILKVDSQYLQVLPLLQTHHLPIPSSSHGPSFVRVTLLPANHCPGAVMFAFELPSGKKVLHSGDCRFDADCMRDALLKYAFPCDRLYLDTTYLSGQYTFPHQRVVIDFVVEVVKRRMRLHRGRCLVLVGSYFIGKERLFLELIQACGLKWHLESAKKRAFLRMEASENWSPLPKCSDRLVSKAQADLWVVPMHSLKASEVVEVWKKVQTMKQRKEKPIHEIIGISPTGWNLKKGGKSWREPSQPHPNVLCYAVPYSEHSSLAEIQQFLNLLQPTSVEPTVRGSQVHTVLNTLLPKDNTQSYGSAPHHNG